MRAALALGSNLPSRFGDPAGNLREALRRLQAFGEIVAVSSFYETEPVGYTAQPNFLNAAAILLTELGPIPLLQAMLAIERDMGRVRAADTPPKGPRVIDLDLLLCETNAGEAHVLDSPELILPHPQMMHRSFVLQPLAEIAPAMQVPPENVTIAALLARLNGA